MMDAVGNERYTCASRQHPWLSQPQSEAQASTLLWKLKDCFSTSETNSLRRSGDKNVSRVWGCVVHFSLFVGFLKNWHLIILFGNVCLVSTHSGNKSFSEKILFKNDFLSFLK